MRRDSSDKAWKAVKDIVVKRDRLDRLQRILTPAEYKLVRKNAGPLIHVLDPAHYLPAGQYPDLIYKSYNIVLLNRWSHSQLDFCRSPVTGEAISLEERDKWWIRILRGDLMQYEYLKQKGLIKMEDKKVILDNVEITNEELLEKKNSLGNNERIVEVQENKFETVSRMNG